MSVVPREATAPAPTAICPPGPPTHEALAAGGWHARLALRFERDAAGTRLARRAHTGPLVVQKALHPEGPEVCQCIVVHPPGGIVGGDRLELDVDLGPRAHAQLTTPGATKWYRSGGRRATQTVHARVATGAVLEWLPQGTIVFDDTLATSTLRVALAADAAYVGWDVVCLGRTASDERFRSGEWRQRIDVVREDALVWSERALLCGDSALLSSPAGLYSAPVFGTFVAMATRIDDSLLGICRDVAPRAGDGAVTRMPAGIVARYRGASGEAAHAWFTALWRVVRPSLLGRDAVLPRIWST